MVRTAAALVLAALGMTSSAGAGSWVPVGPPGGDVRSLAVDPRNPAVVFLGTGNSVLYRSEDGGRRWRRLEPGFPSPGMSLDDLVVDPRGIVHVGYWRVDGTGGGAARSGDGGRSFQPAPGIAGEAVKALALAPADPDVVVAGTLSGVFGSRDGGRTWSRISPAGDRELRNVNSIAIDPADPGTIYAGTWHLPWKTTDGGRSWRAIHSGMINDSDIMTLTVDRRSPQMIYATACTGIYRSTDAALRWAKLRGIPASSRRTRAFAQHPSRPEVLLAGTTEGLWTSEDSGASWRLRTGTDLVVNAVLPLPDGTILAGGDGAGVLRSVDDGRTWAESNEGFSERFVSRIAFAPGGERAVAGVLGDRQHGGVFEAAGGEGQWRRRSEGLEGREVLALALIGELVLAGTDDGIFASTSGVWRRLPTVVDGTELHPRVSDLASLSDDVFLAASSQGLLRSADGGQRWQRRFLGVLRTVDRVAVSRGDSPVAIAATPLGFFLSRDGGAAWASLSGRLGEARVHALAFLPGSDRVVFAATPRGLFKSEDQGRTWRARGGGLPLLDITALAPAGDGRTLFAGEFSQGGVWRSEDAGETWAPFPTTGLATSRVWSLTVGLASPARLLAATPSGGLHEWRPTSDSVEVGSR